MTLQSLDFKKKSFVIYGLGLTGKSALKFLKRQGAKTILTWDDFLKKKNYNDAKKFKGSLNSADYIIISPGININSSIFKKSLIKNKKKILTDLDLFYLKNNLKKSIVITGTNGKSTTCSLVHHVLKKNKIQSKLAGNIGRPILDLKFSNRDVYVIEASSYHLEYSKFIKPLCAAILNISKDHIDWHGSKSKYVKAKFKIFINQDNKDKAFLKHNKLKKIYKQKKFMGKLYPIKKNSIKVIDVENDYLQLEANQENLSFAFSITKIFGINKVKFINALKSFKGLPHRQEVFLKKGNIKFINDSKATSFESSKYALNSNDNIIWILGGMPKKNDKIVIDKFRKKIIKAYIIGNHPNFFSRQLKKGIKFEIVKNLKTVIGRIFKEIKKKEKKTVLFSPASASFDQFKNFNERGDIFKKFVKQYAKRYN